MDQGYPEIPTAAIPEGWERRGRSEDSLFDAGAASVTGRTVLYADAETEAAIDRAGMGGLLTASDDDDAEADRLVGIDTVAPFAFATALSFRPPLAPGIGSAALFPMILRETRRSFETDLRSRGFEAVERDPHGRIRTETGPRARLTKYAATYPLGADAPIELLRVEGWLAVWTHEGSFRVAGGAYPTMGLADLRPDHEDAPRTDPTQLREALLGLIRAVR